MIACLKSGSRKPPVTVTDPPGKERGDVGFLTPTFDEGTLLLKSKSGEHYRLAWIKDERDQSAGAAAAADSDRRRALPAGEYQLTNYVLLRRDAKQVQWFLSATGRLIRKIIVKAGEEQKIKLAEAVFMQCRAKPAHSQFEITMMIAGEHHSGLSLYRNGRRIPVQYRIIDQEGNELATGPMQYG